MIHRFAILVGLAALGIVPARHATAQLTLRQAFSQADHAAYANRIAAATTAAHVAQAVAPLAGILPNVRFEAGYIRTTDPIGTFGATLRQRGITQADFAPDRLNYPAAVGNYQGGIVLEQPIFNADALTGRRAANLAAQATIAAEEWTRLSTRVDVVRAYYGAVLATERAATLAAAARAAHAHVAQAQAMVKQGLVTSSDALLASVRAGEIDAQLAEAQGGAATARQQLAVVLGRDGADLPVDATLPASLPLADRIRAVVSDDTAAVAPALRADVRAAAAGLQAARGDELRARSSYLPRINTFARYDWNSAAHPYGGDRNWTAGVMATWSPFAGAGEISDMQAASGRAAAAKAQSEAADAQAHVDVEQSRTALVVALTRLGIAESGAAQSAEAHRIVARKYEGGLASVSELLDAQATETQSALALSQARYSAIVAGAERRRAIGGDPATLGVLDDGNPAVAATPSR